MSILFFATPIYNVKHSNFLVIHIIYYVCSISTYFLTYIIYKCVIQLRQLKFIPVFNSHYGYEVEISSTLHIDEVPLEEMENEYSIPNYC